MFPHKDDFVMKMGKRTDEKFVLFFYIEIRFSEIILVGKGSRKIRNEELHNLCSSPISIKVIKINND
jgi:hypothetical protein